MKYTIALILCPPIGLYLIWRDWSRAFAMDAMEHAMESLEERK